MTRLLISLMILSVFVLLSAMTALAEPEPNAQPSTAAPPLLRSGDFAISLAEALGLGVVNDEVEAQSLLAARGIAPRNGWFANYPVTPLVMGELRETVINSSESGRLAVTKSEALTAFDGLALDLGLAVDPSGGQAYAEAAPPGSESPPGGEPPPGEAPYGEPPPGAESYYYGGEPPIMAYYPPPPAYLSYYDWVPYPFYYSGFPFSGFFILTDFHRIHRHKFHGKHFHGKHFDHVNRSGRRLISNQRFDRGLGQTVRVRPRAALRAERLAATLDRRAARAAATGRALDAGAGVGRTSVTTAVNNSGAGSAVSSSGTGGSDSLRASRRAERLERASAIRGNSGTGRSLRGSELSRGESERARGMNALRERRSSNDFRPSGSSGRGSRSFQSSDSFRSGGDFNRSRESFRRGGGSSGSSDSFRGARGSFRSSDSFRGSGSFRSSNSFRGGGGDSFRSFRSSDGGGRGGGSFRSGGSRGFSGRGGGFSSRGGGGGGGGRGGRR